MDDGKEMCEGDIRYGRYPEYPRVWYRHTPTGNLAFSQGYGFFIEKGAKISPTYDDNCLYSITYEALNVDSVENGILTRRNNLFTLKNIDFVTTGKMPTEESLSLWVEFKRD